HANQREREEHDRVGQDQQRRGLVEQPAQVVDGGVGQGQRDDHPGQREHLGGAAFQEVPDPARVPHREQGHRQRQQGGQRGGQHAVGGGVPGRVQHGHASQ